ncbi:DUF1515 domain-containing protein [Rhizobium sp. YJ-22]|uniref:DUF1515 domain-containing protein n=1 Tax=Rhizobium sp. YJ-22 TaxID=3037556 RepID=UPI00241229BA|nr:DUF1515 domain-containing protein [Rhizobium sp. YJ-22]MDG3577107.1 DUF1515 domain-containing protein [Rhizobium sp. YJ-22]
MAESEETQIVRVLGRLEQGMLDVKENLGQIREDFRDEKAAARESRAVIHRRLDEQAAQIAHLDETVSIHGQIDGQIRDRLIALEETVKKNQDEASPIIEDMKRMKTIGAGIAGAIAFAGLTVGGMLAWFGETAVQAVRHWLRIP